jgi:hypothetical protein
MREGAAAILATAIRQPGSSTFRTGSRVEHSVRSRVWWLICRNHPGRCRRRAGSRSGSADLREVRGSALVLVEHFAQVVD